MKMNEEPEANEAKHVLVILGKDTVWETRFTENDVLLGAKTNEVMVHFDGQNGVMSYTVIKWHAGDDGVLDGLREFKTYRMTYSNIILEGVLVGDALR